MSLRTLQSLYGQKAWTNGELFAALAALDAQQFPAQLQTMIRSLNHIYVVDRIFRAHLSGQPRPYDATNTAELPSLEDLRRSVAECDAWFQRHVAELTAERLDEVLQFTFTDGDAGAMSREEILLHVIHHGAYHRGNVGQVLKGLGLVPPRDLYTKFLHLSEPARRGR